MYVLSEYFGIIEKLFTALIVAVPTAMISSHLAVKKYRTDRWWDKKAEAYLEAISALNDVILYCDYALEYHIFDMNRDKHQVSKLKEQFDLSCLKLRAQNNASELLFSPDACEVLRQFNFKLSVAEEKQDLEVELSSIRVAAEDTQRKLSSFASKNLQIK